MEAKAKRGVVGQRDLLITMRGILDVAGEYIRRNLAENEQGAPLMLDLADWWYSEPHVRLSKHGAWGFKQLTKHLSSASRRVSSAATNHGRLYATRHFNTRPDQ